MLGCKISICCSGVDEDACMLGYYSILSGKYRCFGGVTVTGFEVLAAHPISVHYSHPSSGLL